MNRWIFSGLVFAIFLAGGCKIQSGDQNAIRETIEKHLNGRSDLNLGAMEHEVKQVSIDRDQATAQVEFHLKQGGASMQVDYKLQRRDGAWTILNVQPTGGQDLRPGMGQPPSDGSQAGAPSSLPSFRDLINHPSPPDGNSPPVSRGPSGETGTSGKSGIGNKPADGSY